MNLIAGATSANQVDLAKSWSTVWTDVSGATGFSKFSSLLAIVGVLLVVFSIGRYLWQRRTGQSQHQHVLWTLVVGGVLVLPDVLIPALLAIADVIINAIINILG